MKENLDHQKSHHTNHSKNTPFFSPAVIQPQLTINEPGDEYEQEADRMADHVMRMESAGSPMNEEDQPVQRMPLAISRLQRQQISEEEESVQMMPLPIQRKCAACEQEEQLQRQEMPEEEESVQMMPLSIQRKCAACEEEENGQLQKMPLMRKANGGGYTASSKLTSQLSQSKGGGSSLPAPTLSYMNKAFGTDFSHVRVHTSSQAQEMSQGIQAKAFTHGSDIYFNKGQYIPESSDGKKLLAHELTHVVQQGETTQLHSKKQNSDSYNIQRSLYFAPNFKTITGTFIHDKVLPETVNVNSDLFAEVKIPGADKKDVETGRVGIADLYWANKKNTVGISVEEGIPNFLRQSRPFVAGNKNYKHDKKAAPLGGKHTPKVRNLDFVSENIKIGDLKPGSSSETWLGQAQIANYIKGIENTSQDMNDYLKNNPKESNTNIISWNPKVNKLTEKEVKIPPVLKYQSGEGLDNLKNLPLAVFREGSKKPIVYDSGLKGTLYMYKSKLDGIWAYEWIPRNISYKAGNENIDPILNRLNNEVIPHITSKQKRGIGRKLQTSAPKIKKVSSVPIISKNPDKFKDEKWKGQHFNPWKITAEEFLGKEKELDKAKVGTALLDVNNRIEGGINIPDPVKERAKGFDKIKHWVKFGKLYGWLREKFDSFYTKFQGIAAKIKEKAKLLKSKVSSSFSGFFKAAIKIIFKIFRMVGSWALTQIANKLLESLQNGIQSNIEKIVNMFTPEGVKSKIEEFESYKDKYQNLLEEKEDELLKLFFGNKLQLLEDLSGLEKTLGNISTIVDLVKWGIRILACASPPLLGCLWNLTIHALEYAFSKLIQTCWFTKEVYEPVISNVSVVQNFPTEVASAITGVVNERIPMPKGLDPIFSPIDISSKVFSVEDCGKDGGENGEEPSSQQIGIDQIIQEIGLDKFGAFLEMTKKRGISGMVELDINRLNELKSLLKNVSQEEIEQATQASPGTNLVDVETFLAKLKSVKPEEELAKPKENI